LPGTVARAQASLGWMSGELGAGLHESSAKASSSELGFTKKIPRFQSPMGQIQLL
jgi:hypothetical protein